MLSSKNSTTKKLTHPRIGIVGGYGHECLRPLPGAEIARALDGYDDAARKRAEARGGGPVFSDMDDLITKFRPDLIYIGSAYARNGTLAVAALERGFNVVCEKPLAAEESVLRRITQLTRERGLQAIAEFAMRWSPSIVEARSLITAGRIGSVVMIQAQKTYKFGKARPEFYKTRAESGGLIPWVAIHAIDCVTWCSGLRFESVAATHGHKGFSDYPGMEDHASMLFRMEGDVPAVITADFWRPSSAPTHSDDRLRFTGTKGVIEVRGDDLIVIDESGESRSCHPVEDSINLIRARELFNAATACGEARLSTTDSLESTAAALAARDSADAGGGWRNISSLAAST